MQECTQQYLILAPKFLCLLHVGLKSQLLFIIRLRHKDIQWMVAAWRLASVWDGRSSSKTALRHDPSLPLSTARCWLDPLTY